MYQKWFSSSMGTCHCANTFVFPNGTTKALGNMRFVIRTCRISSPSSRIAKTRSPYSVVLDLDVRPRVRPDQLGERLTSVPSTFSANCWPYGSRGSSSMKRCRKETWLGSMPPSTPWSQLHSQRPLNANVYASGATKQS